MATLRLENVTVMFVIASMSQKKYCHGDNNGAAMSAWSPTLIEGDAPIYERLVDVLRADIASGALAAGARLPPQRDLAHRLGVGLGTVTRAYVEAEKAGLVEAHVGRGSFVRGGAAAKPARAADSGLINLFHNIAPNGPADARIADTLNRLRKRSDLIEHLSYAPSPGWRSSGGPAPPGWRAAPD
jgi:DNA-binding transcriptional regulator YhcF (GntR family)